MGVISGTIKLNETCAFIQLSLSRMGDKRGVSSDDIDIDADKEFIKVRKVIFKSPYFDRIKNLDSEIRRYIRQQCFPYESGMHLLPLKMAEQVNSKLIGYKSTRDFYIEQFGDILPHLGVDMKDKLRKVHVERDYDFTHISDQFSFSWQIFEVKVPNSLEGISSDIFVVERRKLQDRMQEAYEEARLLLRETCLNLISHLRSSLESDVYGAPKRLSTSTVTHLQEFLNNFDLRNVTNDSELQSYIKQARRLTDGVDAESLRTLDGLRARIHSELQVIEQSITETMVTIPTRRIRQ